MLQLLTVVLVLALLLPLLLRVVQDFGLPTELTFPNSVLVYHARHVQAGQPIYTDFRELPHVVAPYGPLVYLIPGYLGRITGADEGGLFKIGRSVSLLATLVSAGCVAFLLRRAANTRWALVLLFTAVFLSTPILWPVGMAYRPDAPVMCLVLLGLVVFARQREGRWWYLAVVPFVGAFLFKQSAIVGPGAVFVCLLAARRPARALGWLVLSAGCFGLAFVVLNVATGGMYYLNAVRGLAGNVTPGNIVSIVGEEVLWACLVPFVLATAQVLRVWRERRVDLWVIFFVLSFAVATLSTLRDGSATNYFIETLAVGCVLAGRELEQILRGAELDRRPATLGHARLALLLPAIVYLSVAAHEVPSTGRLLAQLPHRDERYEGRRTLMQRAAERLEASGGDVFCAVDPVNLYLSKPYMLDTFMFTNLADRGVFDDSELIRKLSERGFAAILLREPARREAVGQYQSTPWVRPAWQAAILDGGYRGQPLGPFYLYTRP